MGGSVILGGARTPIGRLSGALSSQSATELGARAITGALSRCAVMADQVDYVIMGQVLQAGQGGNAARQAAFLAGIPFSVPSVTINKMCLSGMHSIHLADLMIRSGEAEIIVAGGMESMSGSPYLLQDARRGLHFGEHNLVDVIMRDGLICAFEHEPMGLQTERYAGSSLERAELDALAFSSHMRAARAQQDGRFDAEIVPVECCDDKGAARIVAHDEGVRPTTTLESLGALRPAFRPGGTITAGNASQISDGAAAVVVCSPKVAERLAVEPLGEVFGYGEVAGPDPSLLTQPSRAIRVALERVGAKLSQIELFEINEAFASVALASMRDLGLDEQNVNVNGGAISLGHPIGMSGARLVLTLGCELRRRGLSFGAAALCGGGGQGDALLLRAPH